MKTRETLTAIVLVLVASGCSKNQLRTNRIEGTWDITRVQHYPATGATFVSADPEGYFSFESCKLKTDDFCPYVQQSDYTLEGRVYSTDIQGEYRFTHKGSRLEVHEPLEDGTYNERVYYVMVFKKHQLQLQGVNADGSKTIFTLQR